MFLENSERFLEYHRISMDDICGSEELPGEPLAPHSFTLVIMLTFCLYIIEPRQDGGRRLKRSCVSFFV